MAEQFTFRNTKMAYAKMGEGQPLLILHGWGSNSGVMAALGQYFSRRFTCYLPDLPGHGMSPEPPEAWSVDDYADLVQAFVDEIRGGEAVAVLAHSFGGRIMLKLMAREDAPRYFNRVIITGGAGMKPHRSWKFYFRKYLAKLLKSPAYLLPGKLRDSFLHALRQTSIWKMLGSSEYAQLSGVMRETFVKTVTEYLEPTLPKIPIDIEVLLVWGENDDATPLYQAQRMEQGIPQAELVTLKDAGHYAFLDQPSQFRRVVDSFLKK